MLLIDTCGVRGSVGIADLMQSQPVVIAERELPGRETQERLMLAITEVLGDALIDPPGIDVLVVVTGPGSFTGIRIGLAAAKGLAEALGKPMIALSRLAVLAAQASRLGIVQAWIDAGRGDVFVGRYRYGACLSERMMHGADAFAAVPAGEPVVVMEEQLIALYPSARLSAPVDVREALPLAWVKVRAGDFADTALLDANYLRVPDAELARLAAESRRGEQIAGATT